jgi:glycosyltransferase involved in cell wall biosynthesis
MSSAPPPAPAGAIVLAAYEPDVELFTRQLRSIRDQTVTDWICIISVDGEGSGVRDTVRAAVDDDPRFLVHEGPRLGFVGNFERGLQLVPDSAQWVALSDQDDQWYPQKLATLLPHLEHVDLVSGQARLVQHPSGRVLGETARRDVGPQAVVLNNQFTGSLMAFRGDLLAAALPVPQASTRAAAHDHWIAVVAAHRGGSRVVPDIVQDYVQHDANVFGDPSSARRGGLRASVANARAYAVRYRGSASLGALVRTTFDSYVGWRQLMVTALAQRIGASRDLERTASMFGRRRRLVRLLPEAVGARRRGEVPASFVVLYLVSWASGTLIGGRRLMPPAS